MNRTDRSVAARSRRRFLRGIGTTGLAGMIAGCTDVLDEPLADDREKPSPDGDEGTPTDTPTETPRDIPEPFGDGVIDFSLTPTAPADLMREAYGPLREYLSDQVQETELIYGTDAATVVETTGTGTGDLAETGPVVAALGAREHGVDVLLQRHAFGSWTYASTVITRESTDVSSPSDLRGRSIAFADPLSVSGSLFPLYALQQAGLDVGDAPDSDSGADFDAEWLSHAKAFEALMDGQVDAAGVGRFIAWNYETDEYKEGIRAVAEREGIPRAPIVASPELTDGERSAVVEALEKTPESIFLGEDGKQDTADDLWFDGFREIDLDTYRPFLDVADALDLTLSDYGNS